MPDGRRTRADAEFAAFVEREHDALLTLAGLLEEDPRDAEALVRRTLAKVRRRWVTHARRGDPGAAARAVLVRRVLTRRPGDGPRTSGWVDDVEAAWGAPATDELRRALADLPARTRVATVLARWSGLPPEPIAALLRDSPAAARDEVAAGTARLASVLAPGADLARELAAVADAVPSTASSAEVAEAARRDTRSTRRRRVAGTAAAVAAVATAVAVAGSPPAAPAPEPPVAGPSRPSSPAAPPVDLAQLAPRGSLAGDEAFLAELRALPWELPREWGAPEDLAPAAETRRVLFAGDVPGGRWALVVGRPPAVRPGQVDVPVDVPVLPDEYVLGWFTGPPGAEPAAMRLRSYPSGLVPGMLPSLLDPRTGTMVVLAAPGDVVEVSGRPELAADGSRSRTWVPATMVDGVALSRLDTVGLPWLWSVSFRLVSAVQDTAATGMPDVVLTEQLQDLPPIDVRYPRGRPGEAHAQAVRDAAGNVLTQLGLPPGDTEITAHVTADLPAPHDGVLALVSVRVPSGALVVTSGWSRRMPDGTSAIHGDCGTEVRPAGAPAAERVVAAGCELWDEDTGVPTGVVLAVTAPAGVTAVRTYDGDGDYLGAYPVADGALVVTVPAGTSEVEAVTADGVLLGRTGLLSTSTYLGE